MLTSYQRVLLLMMLNKEGSEIVGLSVLSQSWQQGMNYLEVVLPTSKSPPSFRQPGSTPRCSLKVCTLPFSIPTEGKACMFSNSSRTSSGYMCSSTTDFPTTLKAKSWCVADAEIHANFGSLSLKRLMPSCMVATRPWFQASWMTA